MEKLRVPLERPKPDIDRFMAAMRGEVEPERPPLVEYIIDNKLLRWIEENLLGIQWIDVFDGIGLWEGMSALIRASMSRWEAEIGLCGPRRSWALERSGGCHSVRKPPRCVTRYLGCERNRAR